MSKLKGTVSITNKEQSLDERHKVEYEAKNDKNGKPFLHAKVGEKLFDQNEKSAPVLFDSPGQAFYSPKNDDIHLPCPHIDSPGTRFHPVL